MQELLKDNLHDKLNEFSYLPRKDRYFHYTKLINDLSSIDEPIKKDVISTARKCLKYITFEDSPAKQQLQSWINTYFEIHQPKYSSHLYSESDKNALLLMRILTLGIVYFPESNWAKPYFLTNS